MAVRKKIITTELQRESVSQPLEIQGEIPSWLQGTLIRNGPVTVNIDGVKNSHWFDGLAMLHAFAFGEEGIYYSNKFLRSDAYKKVFKEGSLGYEGFAVDPCKSIFKRFFTWFVPYVHEPLHNANVNVAKLADQYVALTETPLPVKFNKETLDTLGAFKYDDELPKEKCWESAHPHFDPKRKESINYLIQYGKTSKYILYRILDHSSERMIIAEIPVLEPAYMHTFAVTENHIILTEFPFVLKPLDLLLQSLAFIKNFTWHPERGTQFIVVNRNSGKVVGKYKTDPFFAFHHVNAFEKEGTIIMDIIRYNDPQIILGAIFNSNSDPQQNLQDYYNYPTRLERFHLSLETGKITNETLFDKMCEFPRINERVDGCHYRFVYLTEAKDAGAVARPAGDASLLYKVDTHTKEYLAWSEIGCYCGEPVFIANPMGNEEDEGVILAVVFDSRSHTSFLLILDGKSFKEIGRAKVSHSLPGGLHGQYFL